MERQHQIKRTLATPESIEAIRRLLAEDAQGRGVGRLLLSWNARPMENRVFVRGTRGTIEVDRFLQTCRIHRVLPGPKFIGIVANAFFSAVKDSVRIPLNVLRFATGMLKPSPGIRRGAVEFAHAARDNATPPFTGEDALRIARLLEGLKPKVRTAFLLAQCEGLSHKAIAEQMGISLRSVERYIADALYHCYQLRYEDEL